MVSIAFGSNLSAPGARLWLAGCPWVSVDLWSPEDTAPPPAKQKWQEEMGAGWANSKRFPLGNARTDWNFTSYIQMANYAACVSFATSLQGLMPSPCILEYWQPINDRLGTCSILRCAKSSVEVTGMKIRGRGAEMTFAAVFGQFTDCGTEIPTPDVLGDGQGNQLGDGSSNLLGVWGLPSGQ